MRNVHVFLTTASRTKLEVRSYKEEVESRKKSLGKSLNLLLRSGSWKGMTRSTLDQDV